MVSKIGHCLNDILFRTKTGQLPIDIPLIVSNHPDYKRSLRATASTSATFPSPRKPKSRRRSRSSS